MTVERRYRDLSLWHDVFPGSLEPRPSLPGDLDVDVAIVGAGYTGLWTAYYLKRRDPSIRIAVIEREIAGFGASGRNGGWCSALFPTSYRRIARDAPREQVVALQWALNDTVDEVGRVAAAEGIDCGFAKGGVVSAARSRAQLARAEEHVASLRQWGLGEDFVRLLGADETRERLRATRVLGGTYNPNCAAIDPLRLVRGLADSVERMGVAVYEQTPALAVDPTPRSRGRASGSTEGPASGAPGPAAGGRRGVIRTPHGTVRADVVLAATEGYTPDLPGRHREVIPMYSLMIATEPLPDDVWAQIGLSRRETFADKRNLVIYGQRTVDGRLAFGGRGAPYHFGSRVRPEFDRDERVHAMLRRVLVELLPVLRDARVTHAWGGNLAIPRDWYPSVGFDPRSGLAWAGGYVGDGVATANLAGRTLADLITGEPSDITRLPWVGRRSRRWEPEPLRWLAVNAVTALMRFGDQEERRTGRPSRPVSWFWRALGH
jgi:glycine/D-amino acid oxidase-like deaminating enzyme